ncbi:MAG TPA: ABC transporter ATP-binding protein [Thermomicrobiales bacterium]|nr:ABC transporter ATP-binding protein [Thermomicrobiales bacterium]
MLPKRQLPTRPSRQPEPPPALLRVQGLTTRFFTDDGVVHAVEDVSFAVHPGEVLGLVGESGCGKSVTGLSIMRLIPHPPGRIVAGAIEFRGENLLELNDEEMRQLRGNHLSMVFQDPMTAFNPVLSIGKQICEVLELHEGLSGHAARRRAIDLLKMVGIPAAERRIKDYPHQFSGGMRQRAMIAMALACKPELIIADEPTTGLDVTIQAQILDLLRVLREETGAAIIMITHDMGVVAGMCDRVIVMYAGRVVEEASVYELFADPRHPYTIALLGSVPRMDRRRERLEPIGGFPPDLIDARPGCAFAPRCDFAHDTCLTTTPRLFNVGEGHTVACWADVRLH